MSNYATAREVWRHAPPSFPTLKFLELSTVRLLLRPFSGQNNASQWPDNQVFHTHCTVQHQFWLSNCSLISQATLFVNEACEINCLLGRTESCWEGDTHLHCSQPSCKFQHVTSQHALYAWRPCMGVHWAMVLIGDTKQAMSERKSDLVETALTWLGATALSLA